MAKFTNLFLLLLSTTNLLQAQLFEDFTHILDGNITHTFNQTIDEMPLRVSGGVAVADVNNDNYFDILLCLGDNQSLKLLINQGGISFKEQTIEFGLNNFDFRTSSPHFFNYNNDKFIDFIVGSVDGTPPKLFKNLDGQTFQLVEAPFFEIMDNTNTITISSVDYDNDGHIDLFFSHWFEEFAPTHFWKNLGDGTFKSTDSELGFYSPHNELDYIHTSNFMDLNEDGYEDLLLCSDFGTSQIWINNQGQQFIHQSNHVLTDENAMGSAVGDFDNDGDFDWFVSSIYDDDGVFEGNWGGSGNKLYINDGQGNLSEQASQLGLIDSDWAWGSSFADLNNDGFLDLVVVNGWPQGSDQFKNDKLSIFISEEGQYFQDLAQECGLSDTLQGRGVSAIDIDNDGLLDLLVSNYRGTVKLYKNTGPTGRYIKLNLWESQSNPFGFGVQVTVFSQGNKMTQKLSNASNYVSQNPHQLHFGLNNVSLIDSIAVLWNDNSITKAYNIESNQILKIKKPSQTQSNFIGHSVHPNPSSNNISIVLEKTFPKETKFIIIDKLGKKVKEINQFSIHENFTYIDNVDISELIPGVYYLTTTYQFEMFLISFIKI